MTTRLYTHPIYLEHLTTPGHPERPDRLRAIERALDDEAFEMLDRAEAPMGDERTILYAHPESFVESVRRQVPEAGLARIDGDTTLSPKSWQAALTAIGAANAAVDDVFAGKADNVFVASRPPGHHAEKTTAMGFCLFNNAAIAARHAQRTHGAERVAIVDWDVHHGNGTAEIFRQRADVLFFSIHQMPLYPGTGPAEDRGSGPGEGYTVNLPVPPGAGEELWLRLVDEVVIPRTERYEPQLVLVSAGYDAHRADPLASCELESASFAAMAARLGDLASRLGVPLGFVQEGGYHVPSLVESLLATMSALGEAPD